MARQDNKHQVTLSVFDGGLNTKADPINVLPSQAISLKNVVFDDYGAIQNRNGIKTYNSVAITAAGVDCAISYKPSTMSAQLLAVMNGSLYVATGAATAFNAVASAVSVFTPLQWTHAHVFQEIAFFTNSVEQPYKFNGREFTRAGVSAPTQNLTAVCDAAAGNLNGTYQYVFYGVNSYAAEGDYGTASTAVAITSGSVRVNNIPTAPISHGINTWKVARNTAGATGLYWYLTDVTNGTTSFTDNVADSSLVTLAPTDQGYLRKFNFIIAYAGRLWGATEDYLWFSNLNQPEEFPSTNFIRVGRGDGMNISSIAAFRGQIVISKSDYSGTTALYQLRIGDSISFSNSDNWDLRLVSNFGGSEAQKATIAYGNYLLLFNRKGAFAFNGESVEPAIALSGKGASESFSISEMIEPDIIDLTYLAPLRYATAIDWKNKIWLSFDTTGSRNPLASNNAVYVLDYNLINRREKKGGAWTKFPDNHRITDFVVHENMLFGGDSTADGGFRQLDTGETDLGGSFNAQFDTAIIAGAEGHEVYEKDFRWIYVTAKGSGTLTIAWENNSSGSGTPNNGSQAITLTSTYSRHKIILSNTDGSPVSGRNIQLSIQKTISSNNFSVSKVEIIYTLRGLRS